MKHMTLAAALLATLAHAGQGGLAGDPRPTH